MINKNLFLTSLKKSKSVVDELLSNDAVQNTIFSAIEMAVEFLRHDKKLIFTGNGGVLLTLSICLLNMCPGLCLIAQVSHL